MVDETLKERLAAAEERLNTLEQAMQVQASTNLRIVEVLSDYRQRIDILEGNGQKPSALILPPGLQH